MNNKFKKTNKTKQLVIRLDPEIKKLIELAAKNHKKKVSEYLRPIIEQEVIDKINLPISGELKEQIEIKAKEQNISTQEYLLKIIKKYIELCQKNT